MTTVGWSTLDVIPSVKGLAGELDRQTRGQFAAAGRRGGREFGDAAGREAGTRFGNGLRTGLRSVAAPLAGILAGLGGIRIFGDMIDEAQEAAKVTRITEQLVRTTGGAANLTATQIGNLAGKLSDYAAVDDEVVQAGENVLLTFRNVQDQVGQGNDVFARASKAALDLSTVLDGDLNGAMLQIGKALNDPIKGLTALGRAGVQFSADQRAQVKAFVENNDLLSAQKIILEELERQVGGSAGANATALDRLQVSFKNLEEAAGTALAPALNKFATIATDDVIPAAQAAGGAVADGAHAFDSLPVPIKAATAALVAFKLAQATGVTSGIASGVGTLTSGLDSLRLRTKLAVDEYRNLQTATLQTTQSAHVFTPAVGRMSAALGALQAGAVGAGAGLRRGLSGALSLVGGPWGAAFIGGTAVLAKFWAEHQKAKQRVEEFTNTLDKETGAVTENSREWVAKRLLDAGVLDNADRLGISLSRVTDAALGQKGALDGLNAELQRRIDLGTLEGKSGRFRSEDAKNAQTLRDVLNDTNGTVQQGIADQKLLGSAMDSTSAATGRTSAATETYATQLDKARGAVQKLLDKENERRNKNLSAFEDQTRLAQALHDARKEAEEGRRTLDANSEAGRANRDSLASLADAWNSSADSVKNAKGAYRDMRQNFIDVATEMGASAGQAKRLADRLLGIPKNTPARVTTPGMEEALERARELRKQLAASAGLYKIAISNQAAKNRDEIGHAAGGLIRGPGSGTSDSIPAWLSNGEFVQRKAAVDYYGADFMRRLNALQIPRYAGGGLIGGGVQTTSSSTVAGQELTGVLRLAADGTALIDGVVRRGIDENEAAYVRRRRAAAIGGIPL